MRSLSLIKKLVIFHYNLMKMARCLKIEYIEVSWNFLLKFYLFCKINEKKAHFTS